MLPPTTFTRPGSAGTDQSAPSDVASGDLEGLTRRIPELTHIDAKRRSQTPSGQDHHAGLHALESHQAKAHASTRAETTTNFAIKTAVRRSLEPAEDLNYEEETNFFMALASMKVQLSESPCS